MSHTPPTGNTIMVKPYTLKELAAIYGINRHTMRKWLKPFSEEIGPRNGLYFSIPQVKIIFSKLDLPHTIHLENGE